MKFYPLYILDLDGTLYRGDEPIPNAREVVAELRERGALIRYLTNNSGQTREFYVEKLNGMGFAAQPNEIYSSGIGAAAVCNERGFVKVFFVGNSGLRETLEQAGVQIVNEDGGRAVAVVAGICHAFTYDWLNAAMQQILGGAKFIATNTDATYPMEQGRVIPGAGSIIAAIQACSGQMPFVVGKPNPFLIELILKDSGCDKRDALVVGDRYDTDIVSGLNAGVDTHLVLTGVTREAPQGQSFSQDLRGLLE